MTEEAQNAVAYCPECGEEYDSTFNACPQDGTKLYHYRAGEAGEDDPMIGEVIDGRFEIEQVLGQGGMGKVYRARQMSVDRPVALKVLHRAVGSNEAFIKRFLREARVISGFNHPNIVRLVDFGQDLEHDMLYLVMEMLDGTDLSGLLERGRLRVELAIEIALQVCAALSEPHAHDVVHRDLKPDNLMLVVTTDGSLQVKVLDFGIALAAENTTKLTKTGVVHGTPSYMAPEQAQGNQTSGRTDVYALGIILFEMLVGRTPFVGDTAVQIVLQHVQSPAPDVREFLGPQDVPDALVQLVAQMIRKAPDQRPQSVLEVRDRLEEIQREFDMPRVRLDTSKSFDERFEPWLLEPLDFTARKDGPGQNLASPASFAATQGVEPERAAANTEPVGDEVSDAVDDAVDDAPPTVVSSPVAERKRRWPLVVALVVIVAIIGGGAAWWLSPTYEYAGPGADDPEYVWPWTDDPNYAWPWSDEVSAAPDAKKAAPAHKAARKPASKRSAKKSKSKSK